MNKKIKVLLVEDEPIILRSIKRGVESFDEDFEVAAIAYDGIDALELIEQEDFDIVITDIVMPSMSGLEMIQAVKKCGKTPKIILISGYEKFEFAQRAIEMGVAKYLLKPVDFGELEKCLKELKADLYEKKKREEKRYLQDLSNKYQDSVGYREREFYYLFVLVAGSLGRSEYEKLPQEIWMCERELEIVLDKLEERYQKDIYPIAGHYPNEKFFIIVSDTPRWMEIEKFANDFYKHLQMKMFFTLCYSAQAIQGSEFQNTLTEIHCELPFSIVYGRNILHSLCGKEAALQCEISEKLKIMAAKIKLAFQRDEIVLYISECVKDWKERQVTQFQLYSELRYLMESMANDKELDCMKFLYGRKSYEELEEILLETIVQSLGDDSRKKMTKSDLLAEAVKNYLDEHFTEDIIYKDFNHIFGYNEKYITTVFKEKTGISPSRYVLEKRMEKAKEILLQEKGILLKEAAERVGYPDALYFSKVFKNSTGVSPSAFVKKQGTGEFSDKNNIR